MIFIKDMNDLVKFLVDGILLEDIKKTVVVYSGRFQPFHRGHYATYQELVSKFGKDNVYIATSNKTDNQKSPFNFKEKKLIMQKMFGIPSNKIVEVRNPYAPMEILANYPEETTGFVTAVGEKDEMRLSGKYFQPYKGEVEKGYKDAGYVYISPSQTNAISGTEVRNMLSKGTEDVRKKNFMKAYPKFDEKVFKLITLKLSSLKEDKMQPQPKGLGFDDDTVPSPWLNQPKSPNVPYSGALGGLAKAQDKDSNIGIAQKEMEKNWLKKHAMIKGPVKPFKEDKIPGGLAKGMTLNDIAKKHKISVDTIVKELKKGMKVEMEHTTDVNVAKEIAFDHLYEDPKYYDKLAKIEKIGESYSGADASSVGTDSANSTTGNEHNISWDDYDDQDYYIINLPGWDVINKTSSQLMGKDIVDRILPLHNHRGDENGEPQIVKLRNAVKPLESFFEAFGKGQLFAGKIKIGGQTVELEVELLGADNKTKEFITKIIHIDKQYQSKLPIGSIFNIPARIFRTPGGGWHKIKYKAFETVNTKTHKPETDAEHNFLHHHKTSAYTPDYGYEAELDTYDFDDRRKKEPGHQLNAKDGENRGYEPVKKVNESLLIEGGAYGHMNHPFDIQMNLTFGDLKNIVKQALSGKLELAREKTDGQALAVSWVNGRLVAARNKSHLKNKGKDAMSVQDVISKFAGRGSVSDAFSFAIKDLESAIKGLPEASKKKIFKDGSCFMNCEIIYPANTNVIPYGQSLLVFHGTMTYDKDGNATGQNAEAGSQLAAMVKKVNADVQAKFTIQGPPVQKLPVNKDLKSKQGAFLSKIQALQSEFGLTDKNGVADYHQAWWMNFVNKNTSGLDELHKIGLVKRWAFGDKSFRIKDIKDSKNREWAEKIEKQDQQKITKENLLKFETIFLGVGAEVLSFMTSVLTVNPEAAKQQMVGRLETAIASIKATGDAKNLDKLNIELARIEALGGFDKIVPNEGIVFNYKGNTFKLTGAFAPLNQILGIFTFSR